MTWALIDLAQGLVVDLGGVLGRDDHRVDADRDVVLVLDRHLALGVGAEPGDRAVLAQLGDLVDDPVRQRDRQGHQLGRLVGGVAEHQALVAGADVLARGGVLVHALGDVGGLLAQGDHHGAGGGVEPHVAGGVADVADDLADDGGVVDHRLGRDLAGQADQAGGQEALAGHPGVGVLGEDGVEDAVGDLVGHLVGMAHRDRLAGEQVLGWLATRRWASLGREVGRGDQDGSGRR